MKKQYRFKAIEMDSGVIRDGTIAGESMDEVVTKLRKQGLRLIDLKKGDFFNRNNRKGMYDITWRWKRSRWSYQTVSLWATQLEKLLAAGVDLVKALNLMAEMRNTKEREVIRNIQKEITNGNSLSTVLKSSNVFPELFVQMIKAGEVSGTLAENLAFSATFYREQEKQRKEWEETLTYPLLVLCLAAGVAVLSMFVILPVFASFFEQMGAKPIAETAWIFSISIWLKTHVNLLLALLIVLGLSGIGILKSEWGSWWISSWTRRFALIRYRMYSRVCKVMAMLLKGGLDFTQTLQLTGEITGNQIDREGFLGAREMVMKGVNPIQALRDNQISDSIFLYMLEVGMESGQMAELLTEAGDLYEAEAKTLGMRYRAWLGPFVLVLVGTWTAIIVFSVMMPVIDAMTASIK